MSTKKANCGRLYDTNRIVANILHNLRMDFATSLSDNERSALANFTPNESIAKTMDLRNELAMFKERSWTLGTNAFKQRYQLASLLDKFRFEQDAYTDDELHAKLTSDFIVTQLRLNAVSRETMSGAAFEVVRRARQICRLILGKFDSAVSEKNSKFGERSSIGCPLHLAYPDMKLGQAESFTSSRANADWFYETFDDLNVHRLIGQFNYAANENLHCESNTLIAVPKSWKSLRGITPLALLNLFRSYGVGIAIEHKLRHWGLDIKHLQEAHALAIKDFSLDLTHVTADLSTASDSFMIWLLNMVLPRDWFCELKYLFTRRLSIDGVEGTTLSALPMGNAATFPVETLIFYCLIRAIGSLTNTYGTFSVYGDDLIYPTSIHRIVVALFPQFGFKLNLEKTFVKVNFRESCGADYFAGVNVRPWKISASPRWLTRSKMDAYLYKAVNGLLARWSPYEVPTCLQYLYTEICNTSRDGVLRVPPSFPDTSGVKVCSPYETLTMPSILYRPVKAVFRHGSVMFDFAFLSEMSPKRYLLRASQVQCYYLIKLIEMASREDPKPGIVQPAPQTLVWDWVKTTDRKLGRKNKRWVPYVATKVVTKIVEVDKSTHSWTYEV